MRYVLDKEGYIAFVSIGKETPIECNLGTCNVYTGSVPEGYESLCDWQCNANIRAYKIVDDNLVYDVAKDNELQEQYKKDAKDNSSVLHKEIYGLEQQIEDINAVNNSQYQRIIGTGKVVTLDNIKATYPRIKINNIKCYSYDKIKIIVNGKNMLPNDAVSQSINGIEFKQNKDKSINIDGTASEKIEYNIAGSSTNTSPFLMLKKDMVYCLNTNGFVINMYSYDGTDRTEVYSGTGGIIKFTDSDKEVTHITLSIDKEETVDNIVLYPQLEFGSNATDYESYKVKTLDINFSEFIEDGLFPNDNLFPSDDLFPSGTTIDYILAENGKITSLINDEDEDLGTGYISVFDGYNTIYTMQDTSLEVECCINNLKLEGTVTKNNNFKVLADGSIEAHNGKFSGTIETKKATITGGTIDLETELGNVTIGKGDTGLIAMNVVRDGVERFSQYNVGGLSYKTNGGYRFRIGAASDTPIMRFYNGENNETIYMGTYNTYGLIRLYAQDGSMPIVLSAGTGIVRCITLTQTSLESSKKNIEKYSGALEEINKTDIYKYNLKHEEDNAKKHLGFVIGENYNYSKEITATDEEGNEIGVDSYSMTSLCLQAIKELNEKVKELENKLKEREDNGKN